MSKRIEPEPLIIETRAGKMSLVVGSETRAFITGRFTNANAEKCIFIMVMERDGIDGPWQPVAGYSEEDHGCKQPIAAFVEWANAHPNLFKLAGRMDEFNASRTILHDNKLPIS